MNLHDMITLVSLVLGVVGSVAGFYAKGHANSNAQKIADFANSFGHQINNLNTAAQNHDAQLTSLGQSVGTAIAKADVLLSTPPPLMQYTQPAADNRTQSIPLPDPTLPQPVPFAAPAPPVAAPVPGTVSQE